MDFYVVLPAVVLESNRSKTSLEWNGTNLIEFQDGFLRKNVFLAERKLQKCLEFPLVGNGFYLKSL